MTDIDRNQGCASLIVLLVMALIMLFTIVDDGGEHAHRAIQNQGMTDIRMGDHAWFACADYETATNFTAVNPQGERVEGVVCCGLWMKACTIRW